MRAHINFLASDPHSMSSSELGPPLTILQEATKAWNKHQASQGKKSLSDGSSAVTSLYTDNGTITDGAEFTNEVTTKAATVDASCQTEREMSTYMSDKLIAETLDYNCQILIALIARQAVEDSENRFAIWKSLIPVQQFGRVRSVIALLWAFKPLETKEALQATVHRYRTSGNTNEEKGMVNAICEATLGDLTRTNIYQLLVELKWLEKRFHREETQWQLDNAILQILAYSAFV